MRFAPVCVRQTVLAIAVGFAVLFVGPGYAASPRALVNKIERVSDSDTLTATVANGTRLRIRLLGIDAPEIGRMGKTSLTLV